MRIETLLCPLLCMILSPMAAAQSEPETPETIRRDMAIIKQYGEETERLLALQRQVIPIARVNTERDPFEVSARLREGFPAGSRGEDNAAVLKRELKLKAMVRANGVGMAQILLEKELMIVNNGDELELKGVRYMVKIDDEGVQLRGLSAPQNRIWVR